MGITDDLEARLKRSYRIAIALAVLGLLIGLVAVVFGASAGRDLAPRDLRAVAPLVPMPQTLLEYARL
jgi:hypothetical protein